MQFSVQHFLLSRRRSVAVSEKLSGLGGKNLVVTFFLFHVQHFLEIILHNCCTNLNFFKCTECFNREVMLACSELCNLHFENNGSVQYLTTYNWTIDFIETKCTSSVVHLFCIYWILFEIRKKNAFIFFSWVADHNDDENVIEKSSWHTKLFHEIERKMFFLNKHNEKKKMSQFVTIKFRNAK